MTRKVTTRAGRRVYRGAPKPLPEGARPHCARVIAVSARGRRRAHNDGYGNPCTGGGIPVDIHPVHLTDIPPVRIPDIPSLATVSRQGHAVLYAGGSDRKVRHGRAECPHCERHLPLNADGTLRAHRITADDPLAPRCTPAPIEQAHR